MKEFIFKRVLFLLLLLSPILTTVAGAQMIAYGLESQIWVMDVQTRQKFTLITPPGVPRDKVDALAWSSDGKTIAARINGDIWLADVISRKIRVLIRANHQPFAGTPAWSKDGKFLYVGRNKYDDGDADEGLWQINVQNGQSRRLIQPEDVDWPIQIHPIISADGHYLISSEHTDGASSFYAIDLRSNKPIKFIATNSGKLLHQQIFKHVICCAFDKSCKMLLLGVIANDEPFGKGPGGIWRWNLNNNTCSPWILHGQSVDHILMSPDGKTMIISIARIEKEKEITSFYEYDSSGKKLAKITVLPGDNDDTKSLHYINWLDNETMVAEKTVFNGETNQTDIILYGIRTGKSHILVKGGYGVTVAGLRPH